MNYIKKYWLPILIIVLVVISFTISLKPKEPRTNIALDSSISGQHCFVYEQELTATNEYPESVNREYIELAIDNDGLVSGIHTISSPRFDINERFEIIGVSDGEFVNAIASVEEGEGLIERQELYKITGDTLYVGYQTVDVPQYQNENGVFMYEDINKIQFESDDFFLTRVACGDAF